MPDVRTRVAERVDILNNKHALDIRIRACQIVQSRASIGCNALDRCVLRIERREQYHACTKPDAGNVDAFSMSVHA